MNMAEEDATGIELMAAQFRHQAAACRLIQPPTDQLLDVIETILFEHVCLIVESVIIRACDGREPAVTEFRLRHVWDHCVFSRLGVKRPGEIAMPQSANVANVAEDASIDNLDDVSIEHTVMALMADREDAATLLGCADHLLALLDVPGHQLLGQNVDRFAAILADLHG